MKTSFLCCSSALILTGVLTAGEPGKVQREVWKSIAGSGTWYLKNDPRFHGEPDLTEFIEGVEPKPNAGDNYGERLRGYVIAPASGDYRFYIAGDDNCELWLGEGESKFKISKVAWIVGTGYGYDRDWSGPRQWRKVPSQESGVIKLEAGKKYFFEVIHKEGVGNDHVSVGWLKPEAREIEVVPPSALESYSKNQDAGDVDCDELGDQWEEANGLNPRDQGGGASISGALGDPDADGMKNWEEQRHQTDPQSGRGRAGYLQRDLWYGVWGRSVTSLMAHRGYYLKPDSRDLVNGASVTTDLADRCGMRLRGFLLPPESGDYEFWLAGDDHCELWLSDGESKFEVQRLAAVNVSPGWVRPGEWDKLKGQHSAPVRLEGGKRYYIEVLLKEGVREDFVSVAWRRPGGEREEIPSQFFESFVPSGEDRDDDGLPGAWEESFGLDPLDMEGDQGALGDPDGDMIPNFLEYSDGTSPVVANVLAGATTVDVWNGLGGVRVRDLVDAKAFHGPPASRSLQMGGLDFGSRGDRYGMRVRYRIAAPAAGEYRFWIAGDDNCELWLSSDATKYRKRRIAMVKGPGSGVTGDWVTPHTWNWQASQASAPVVLQQGGQYFMEVFLKEGNGNDHVSVAWQRPGDKEPSVVPAEVLSSYLVEAADADDDYLPDEWETRYGLNAEDNGFVDIRREGERGDHDGDRLDNRTEFLLGTNPCAADSDGDGVGDHDEVKVYGSNPTAKDASPPVVVSTLPLSRPLASNMRWTPPSADGTIQSMDRRGESTWEFEVEKAGIYRVDLSGWSRTATAPLVPVPVSIEVDGVGIGEGELAAGPPATKLSYLTRWLQAGHHEVTVVNHNVRSGVSMTVESLEILAQGGDDNNGNGLPDWLENYYRAINRASLPSTGFATSPASLEGAARFFEDLSIRQDGHDLAATRGLRGQWFVNVPLDESGAPVKLDLGFEGGALSQSLELSWRETNLFGDEQGHHVRLGDAMRLTAYDAATGPAGASFKLSIGGATIHEGPADKPFVFKFESEGQTEIEATVTGAGGTVSRHRVSFEVVSAELGADFHVPSNLSRLWTPTKLPVPVLVENDDNLSLMENFNPDGEPRSFEASFAVTRGTSGRVVARLGDNGAILDAATIHGFFLAASTWTGEHHLVRTLADGTRVMRAGYVIDGEIPPDLVLWIQLQVPDAVFSNGSSWLKLTAADFDENGHAEIEILKAPGTDIPYICHWIRPFSEGPEGSEAASPSGEVSEPVDPASAVE